MPVRRLWLLCVALGLFFQHLPAQGPHPRINIELLGPEQGLPDRNTRCIMQDSLGFLWLGTGAGLWRYDGYAFHNYTRLLSRTGGAAAFINDIQKGPGGKLWVAHNNGLAVIDPAFLTGMSLDLTSFFPAQVRSRQTVKVYFDRSGNAWVALPGNALVKMDERAKPLLLYTPPENNGPADGFITKLFEDVKKNLYLFSNPDFLDVLDERGMYSRRITLVNDTLKKEGYFVSAAIASGNDELLIYYGHKDGRKSRTRTFSFSRQGFGPLASNPYFINPENHYPDRNGFVWYKSDKALGFLNRKGGTFTSLTGQVQQKAGVELFFFNAVVSSDNTFWLCSTAGLFKMAITEQFFEKYLSIPLQKPTDVGISMRGLAEDGTGRLWACSYGFREGGATYFLHQVAPATGAIRHLKLRSLLDTTTYNFILYKILFVKDHLYAITDGTGLLKIEPRSLKTRVIPFPVITGNEFVNLYAVNDTTLWIGTLNGMATIHTKTLQPVLLNNQAGPYLKNIRVNYFMPWRANRVLASTFNGLYVLDQNARIVEHFGGGPDAKVRLPSLRILYTTWHQNKLWAGTSDGLIGIDTALKKGEIYTVKEGLPDNTVYAALPDERGNLWLSTNNGLCRFYTKSTKVHNYGLPDGLPHTEFNNASFLKAHNGRLYFGGLNGIVGFDPAHADTAKEEGAALRLIASSRYVARRNRVDTVMGNAVQDKISLGARDRFLSFSFMSPDYRHTAQNRFRYKLEGWDDAAWHPFENGSNKLTFNSLPPGDYTLRVQVSVAGGDWSTKEWSAVLEVKAPWYKTAWFFLGSLLVVTLLFYLFYRYRLAQIMRIQKIRNRISADMHDEIGSTLSSISFYSQALLLQTNDAAHRDVLQKIKENALQVQEGLSDIVWSVKPGMDEIENVFARMFRFGSELLEAKAILFYFEVDERLKHAKLEMTCRKNLYLIYKEALHNAAKYAHCKNVWVQVSKQEKRIRMVIKDDGNGFDLQNAQRGNGLSNMQERARQMKGRLSIMSSEGDGTTVMLLF